MLIPIYDDTAQELVKTSLLGRLGSHPTLLQRDVLRPQMLILRAFETIPSLVTIAYEDKRASYGERFRRLSVHWSRNV